MNVEADVWYELTLNVRFADSQEIDTSDPAWLGKLLSGRLAVGEIWMDDIDMRLSDEDASA